MAGSLRSLPTMTGTIHVNNDALRQLLVDDSLSASQRASSFALGLTTKSLQQSQAQLYGRGSAPVVNRAPTHPHMHAPKQRRNAEDREAARTELRVKYEEEQSLIKRGLQMRREHQQREEEDRFARMYNELMMEEEDFVALVKDYCKLDDQNRLRKQEALCRDWHEKVFNKVQRQIGKQLKSTSSHEIAERRRKLYDQFLAAANSKESGLFRDIIIESEYDPMIGDCHFILILIRIILIIYVVVFFFFFFFNIILIYIYILIIATACEWRLPNSVYTTVCPTACRFFQNSCCSLRPHPSLRVCTSVCVCVYVGKRGGAYSHCMPDKSADAWGPLVSLRAAPRLFSFFETNTYSKKGMEPTVGGGQVA
mmetsp:Transcript_12815/g.30134  ORF Transcript_12815/g.30134 Transcript_12815/m.30134 type:complete len:367 (-) Transcript_12815:81-1181(-)